jgi:hypothetical protein
LGCDSGSRPGGPGDLDLQGVHCTGRREGCKADGQRPKMAVIHAWVWSRVPAGDSLRPTVALKKRKKAADPNGVSGRTTFGVAHWQGDAFFARYCRHPIAGAICQQHTEGIAMSHGGGRQQCGRIRQLADGIPNCTTTSSWGEKRCSTAPPRADSIVSRTGAARRIPNARSAAIFHVTLSWERRFVANAKLGRPRTPAVSPKRRRIAQTGLATALARSW